MDKLKQQLCDFIFYKKNIRLLQTKIQALMDETAEIHRHLTNGENDNRNEVQQWLLEADKILKKARDNPEGGDSMAGKTCLCSACWGSKSSWETSKTLRDINKMLKEREGLDLSSYFCGHSYCKNLQSREDKLQEILEVLTGTHIKMIGIYGMIGVGKTVLVEELARRAQNNRSFDAIVMVQVSQSPSVKLIQSQIARQIGLQLSEDDDEETRAHFLHSALEKKMLGEWTRNDMEPIQQSKILVILDAIWNVIDLVKVGIPYERDAKPSCKVVLISRNSDICKEMGVEKKFLVECLNSNEAKILFQERLGDKIGHMETLERYQYVENVLITKCGGLPLVINLLACTLTSVSWSNWEIIADQLERHTLVEVDEVKEAVSTIRALCYNFIKDGEKQMLFLLCCLIQQGMDKTVGRLVRYGMGFGLSEDFSLAYAVKQVNSWLDELKSLSLLLESKDPQHVNMHDIVQDVTISALSQDDYNLHVLLNDSTCWHTRESYENCVAISLMPDANYKCLNGLELHKLQAFLLKGKPSLSLPSNYFQGMQNLKILDISRTTFVELPSSIGDLKNLVTLHLEYCSIKYISSTISRLAKLEVFSLCGSTVEVLSEKIGDLTKLRVLDLTCCKNLNSFSIDAIAKLPRLEELDLYGSFQNWTINDMVKLKSLRLEVLEIEIPKGWELPPGAFSFLNPRRFKIFVGNSIKKKGTFFGKEHSTSMEQSNSFSCVLAISGISGGHLEAVDLSYLLRWTEFLQIKEVNGLGNGIVKLSVDGYLHLKKLYVGFCHQLRCILDAGKLSMTEREIFPQLEILTLEDLSCLKSICRSKPWDTLFPKLTELRLRHLPLLRPNVLPVHVAAKLRIMEVSDCNSLRNIFWISKTNETDGSEKIVELPYLEKLELRQLLNLQAVQDPLDISITRDEIRTPYHLLFNNKIKFPSLKEICLTNLDKIESIMDCLAFKECDAEFLRMQAWGMEPDKLSPCFINLKCMTISGCKSLESLFPSTNVISLLQLEKLEVESCPRMKEVITRNAEDDTTRKTMITFPKLKRLKLENLRSLECFYRGRFSLEFPMLRELDLSDLWKMKTFIKPVNAVKTEITLFTGEICFPSLEHLQLSRMDVRLITGDGDTTIFPNLSSFTLTDLSYLRCVPDIMSKNLRFLCLERICCFKTLSSIWTKNMGSMPFIVSQEIEELTLSECNNLEELVDNHNQFDDNLFPSLRNLKLANLPQMKSIPWNMLRNLRSLVLHQVLGDSHSLMSTAFLAGGNVLPQLEKIEVASLSSLEAVISKELQEDHDIVKYGMTLFPCLREIELRYLPNLRSFCMGSYEAHFPSLETVEIEQCPGLQSFSSGTLLTPKLKYVELNHIPMHPSTFKDLNVILTDLGCSISEDRGKSHLARRIRGRKPTPPPRKAREEALLAAKSKGLRSAKEEAWQDTKAAALAEIADVTTETLL